MRLLNITSSRRFPRQRVDGVTKTAGSQRLPDRAAFGRRSPGAVGSRLLALVAPILSAAAIWAAAARAEDGPDPIFEKPTPITMAELAKRNTDGVSAVEVTDYAPGHYTGKLSPSPPHADMNPRKAVIVFWKDRSERFVFSHEASYCPYLELSSGAGLCNQFFEGNWGEAELMNSMGRKEKNSFVDIIQSGPNRVWVRWTYLAVNMNDDSQPRLRGTEDYIAYPNGLVLRRTTYESLIPDKLIGYSTQPVELFGVAPVGSMIEDLFVRDQQHGDHLTHSVLDMYSDKRYDIFWDNKGKVRRSSDDAMLRAITSSRGLALVMPFREKLLFAVIGEASGFPAKNMQLIDHCSTGADGGMCWGQGLWDHWPIGWQNSQGSNWKPGSPYSYSFGSVGQFFVPEGKRIKKFTPDYFDLCKDMQFNRWTARRVCYVLLGSAKEWSDVRRIGRSWLDKGKQCAKPESVAELK
jgi:hypothetical protein